MAQQFPLNLNKKNILSQSKSHSTSTTFDDKSLDHRSVEPLSVGQVQRCTLWPNWNLNQLDFTASFQGRLLGDSSGLKKIGSTVFFFFIITQCTEQNWQCSQSINICARYITCVLLRDGLGEPNKHAAIQRAPMSLCSQQTFPPANWVWIRVLSSPLQHSALKFFTFWCNKNGRAHTNQVHIDWHSTAIFPVSEKWGSNRIWQPFDPSNWTAQRCAEGKQCSTSIMNLTFATTSLFSVTLISFIHLYFGFPFVRRADLTFNVWWSFF